MTEFLVDTAKIRILKLLSNCSKNGGSLLVLLLYEVFILLLSLGMDKPCYLVGE